MPPELASDAASELGGTEGTKGALGNALLTIDGVFACRVAGMAGGGGIVPTTGDDIIEGTIGITCGVGGREVVGLPPIVAGLLVSWPFLSM